MNKSVLERLGLMAGALAFIVSLLIFRVNFPALTTVEKGVLTGHLAVSMGVCCYFGGRSWLLGLVVFPLCFLALTALSCWWIVSGKA